MDQNHNSFVSLTSDPMASGARHYKVRTSVDLAIGSISIFDGLWQHDTASDWVSSAYYIELPLSQRPNGAHARYGDLSTPVAGALNRLLVIPPDHLISTSSARGEYSAMIIFLHRKFVDGLLRHPAQWRESALFDGLDVRCPQIEFYMRGIYRELMAPGFATPLILESLCQALGVAVVRRFRLDRGDGPAHVGGLAAWRLQRIRTRIAEGGPLPTIEQLAADCRMSARHLSRAFKQETGTTIAEFARNWQIGRGMELLRTTARPIREIAAELGFASCGSFSHAFRRETGARPSDVRAAPTWSDE